MDDVLGLRKATEELVKLIDPLFRPGAEAVGELAADQVRYWRFKRAIALTEKARDFLKSKNIEAKAVPLKIFANIVSFGSLEEDETLHAKWVGLLASAAAGSAIHPSYPNILEQLSSDEARMLDAMYQRLIENRSTESKPLFRLGDLRKAMTTSVEPFEIILGNLKRLELCRVHDEVERTYGPDMHNNYTLNLSRLGEDFIKGERS